MKRNGLRFHAINVRVKRAGLRVRSRTGFYGTPDKEQALPPQTSQEQLVKALHIDAHDLTFKKEDDGTRSDLVD
jgi:hypothetical protein